MSLIDRIRTETAILRYDFWLEMRGVNGPRRRDLRRELRANLSEATADIGATRALFGIGSPKELAYAATETDPSRPRWSQGSIWAGAVFLILALWMALTSLTVIQTAEAAGVASPVSVHPFPWWGTTFTAQSSPGTLEAGVTAPWQLIVGPLLTFLLVAQPWRRLRSRQPLSVAD
ncbi:hypothetical protein [Knoellia subterranea]|nr:hypothetical protein [Knoellia subterranea]